MSTTSSQHTVVETDLRRKPAVAFLERPWLSIAAWVDWIIEIYYRLIQEVIIAAFKPKPPSDGRLEKPFGKIAVIGAGLTGVSSAAHCMAHNFDVVLFEASDDVGGIWANVNSTSGLQLNSILYRFHPGVRWSSSFPKRDEILGEIRRLWKEYGLEDRTRLNTKVTSVKRHPSSSDPKAGGHARWTVNTENPDDAEEVFDAVIVAVGTCGEPHMIKFPGLDSFRGPVLHSSELDGDKAKDIDWSGKKVAVIGGGASAVEAVEAALEKDAKFCSVSVREDKWIIPRNVVVDTLLSMQPFGREMPLSFIPEWFLRKFHYRDLEELSPIDRGVFEGTPIVNDEFLQQIREGRVAYIRSDVKNVNEHSISLSVRPRGSKPGDKDGAEQQEIEADILILATGFGRPSVDFLPKDLFPEEYERPNLYLQNFATEDWSVLMTNSAYTNAIGTVGHFHIGIYTRILLTLLLDPAARPIPKDMKLWVDVLRFIKRGASGGALGFFTYMELTVWILTFHLFRPDRLRWFFFILFGWGVDSKFNKKDTPVKGLQRKKVNEQSLDDEAK
ncbi:FAD/NAD(P)-binding domain-containing protein [Sistotremastrum suecicum HHB10207 ss-3]|uniref:FAD/NAD(P)-binding domain-containing protein n=1 Tax=Sistotremastrum suecicum HHB10207 ss-3 TaxID=1314776 RepID=A0A165X5U8_9AGAM|nr:FAD/NAD(P)-binding domain-containing protein [Sistotremastrum suecicum HHB10207 ss-3]